MQYEKPIAGVGGGVLGGVGGGVAATQLPKTGADQAVVLALVVAVTLIVWGTAYLVLRKVK